MKGSLQKERYVRALGSVVEGVVTKIEWRAYENFFAEG